MSTEQTYKTNYTESIKNHIRLFLFFLKGLFWVRWRLRLILPPRRFSQVLYSMQVWCTACLGLLASLSPLNFLCTSLTGAKFDTFHFLEQFPQALLCSWDSGGTHALKISHFFQIVFQSVFSPQQKQFHPSEKFCLLCINTFFHLSYTWKCFGKLKELVATKGSVWWPLSLGRKKGFSFQSSENDSPNSHFVCLVLHHSWKYRHGWARHPSITRLPVNL